MIARAGATLTRKHRFFAPEVVQSSAMDCGPAALKSLLEGFGIPVSYGRLREACQTDVDGTSIDTLEEVAGQLGLEAEQILVPLDHVLLPAARALPALAVVMLPTGMTHFVVVWSRHGRLVQVMDPGFGRRWISESRLLQELYPHTMAVRASDWREWAGSEEALAALTYRLGRLGLSSDGIEKLIDQGLSQPGWRPMGSLDAVTRATDSMVRSGGVRKGAEAGRVLGRLLEQAAQENGDPFPVIPEAYWSVRSGPAEHGDEEEQVLARGAVLVRARGTRTDVEFPSDAAHAAGESISPELLAARQEAPARPARELLKLLRADGLLAPVSLISALFLAGAGLAMEALLFRALLELGPELGLSGQRFGALAAVIAFTLFLIVLEFPIAASEFRFGRRLETRLRAAVQAKIPRLGDRYFRSRLTSDMAERNHSVHNLRLLPPLGGLLIRFFFEIVLTVAGIIWLDPTSAPLALLAGALALGIPLAAQPLLLERELRVRSHVAGLSRFYLDALLGLVPLRVHGAGRSLRREHESQLVQWAGARLSLQKALVGVEGLQALVGFSLAAWLLLSHIDRGGQIGVILLMGYWSLNLPYLGLSVAQLAWQYPVHRNVTLRLLEPLGAPEEKLPENSTDEPSANEDEPAAVSIDMQDLHVRAGGHLILEDIRLHIDPGEHVAVVGPSGAGKSSLFGVLLGWHRASGGKVLVEGTPLDGDKLARLRSQTAWVDPTVQIWNRSFLDNLRYGVPAESTMRLAAVIDQADLRQVLELLPDGHQTMLGEGGGLVSGGEGQRVRLGRAMLRPGVRLVLLDEPFRGLGSTQRAELLKRSRQLWVSSTLLCVTHDVNETRSFDRVIVMDKGRIVEDGAPEQLAQKKGRYRAMLDAEAAVRVLWSSPTWRRFELASGKISEA